LYAERTNLNGTRLLNKIWGHAEFLSFIDNWIWITFRAVTSENRNFSLNNNNWLVKSHEQTTCSLNKTDIVGYSFLDYCEVFSRIIQQKIGFDVV